MDVRAEARRVLEGLKGRHEVVYRDIVEKQYSSMKFSPRDANGVDVLDLGAHVGIFSLFMLSHGANSVIAVEAEPQNFSELKKNTAMFPQVIPMHRAVTGGKTSTVMVSNADAQSKIVGANGSVVNTITLQRLVSLMPKGGQRLLKVDVEGSEYEILPHASGRAIKTFNTIFLETHETHAGPGRSEGFLKEYLGALGYEETHKNQIFWWTWKDGKCTDCRVIPNMGGLRFEFLA